ncbi:uncharacterized protein LOC121397980 [Xenopus laevis]|uniref:Uncharacterized protein LOC121397980 n=1 Tax=Xenopus laevis TaxID=8355 RepID=A0A8J1LRP7_XENLA|nr:uncharacterized protein LOC121397980 [Xenopus laevis]
MQCTAPCSQTSDPCTFLLQERDIKQDYTTFSYTKTTDFTEFRPICPVPVESYEEDVESGNTLFVQEEIRPVPLLIPMDLICDGLRCLIPPIEGQLTNPGLELSSAIIQEFLPIVPYIEALIGDTENGTSVIGILLGFLLPEVFAYLLDFYYGRWSSRKKAEKDRDEAPAGRESEEPQSPDQTQDNVEEEAELSGRECKQKEEPRCAKKRNKKQHHSEAHELQVPQKPKSNGTMEEEDEKELKRLFQQFICQCLEGDL